MHQRASDSHTLLFTTRELPRIAIAFVAEADNLEHLGNNLLNTPTALPGYFKSKRDVFGNSFLWKQAKILENNPNLTTEVWNDVAFYLGNIPATNFNTPLGRALFGDKKLDESGFAGATLADNRHKLPWLNRNGDIFQNRISIGIEFGNSV